MADARDDQTADEEWMLGMLGFPSPVPAASHDYRNGQTAWDKGFAKGQEVNGELRSILQMVASMVRGREPYGDIARYITESTGL